jgi:hypothetical protein
MRSWTCLRSDPCRSRTTCPELCSRSINAVVAGATATPAVRDGKVLINATLDFAADSDQAENVVVKLRESVKTVDAGGLVGGVTATVLDTNTTAQRDLVTTIPVVLAVVLVILVLLLRSVLAPVLLVASVVLSYAAAMGVSALVFNNIFGFPGADATVPLFGFVFLVALGVDYKIFLMSRVREESLKHGTRPGILRGLGVTGGRHHLRRRGACCNLRGAGCHPHPHHVPGPARLHRRLRGAAGHRPGPLAAGSGAALRPGPAHLVAGQAQ